MPGCDARRNRATTPRLESDEPMLLARLQSLGHGAARGVRYMFALLRTVGEATTPIGVLVPFRVSDWRSSLKQATRRDVPAARESAVERDDLWGGGAIRRPASSG